MSTSYNKYDFSDDISIQMDDQTLGKPDSQLTEQLYEMARRIAESDRNNEAYREVKKTKSFELASIHKNKKEIEEEILDFEETITNKQRKIYENKFLKKEKDRYEEVSVKYETGKNKQKQIQIKNSEMIKENQKIQKTLQALQIKYDNMMRENKNKKATLQKLRQKKEQKLQRFQENNEKIKQLQMKCEETKQQAQELQYQLRSQRSISQQLEQTIKCKEQSLQIQRREREEVRKREQENKKQRNKLKNYVDQIEAQIDLKLNQFQNLRDDQYKLTIQVNKLKEQQKRMEERVIKRGQFIHELEGCLMKANRESETLDRKINKIKKNDDQ